MAKSSSSSSSSSPHPVQFHSGIPTIALLDCNSVLWVISILWSANTKTGSRCLHCWIKKSLKIIDINIFRHPHNNTDTTLCHHSRNHSWICFMSSAGEGIRSGLPSQHFKTQVMRKLSRPWQGEVDSTRRRRRSGREASDQILGLPTNGINAITIYFPEALKWNIFSIVCRASSRIGRAEGGKP